MLKRCLVLKLQSDCVLDASHPTWLSASFGVASCGWSDDLTTCPGCKFRIFLASKFSRLARRGVSAAPSLWGRRRRRKHDSGQFYYWEILFLTAYCHYCSKICIIHLPGDRLLCLCTNLLSLRNGCKINNNFLNPFDAVRLNYGATRRGRGTCKTIHLDVGDRGGEAARVLSICLPHDWFSLVRWQWWDDTLSESFHCINFIEENSWLSSPVAARNLSSPLHVTHVTDFYSTS